jgi:hypothetical protein
MLCARVRSLFSSCDTYTHPLLVRDVKSDALHAVNLTPGISALEHCHSEDILVTPGGSGRLS